MLSKFSFRLSNPCAANLHMEISGRAHGFLPKTICADGGLSICMLFLPARFCAPLEYPLPGKQGGCNTGVDIIGNNSLFWA